MLNHRTLTFVMAVGLLAMFALSACQPPAGNSGNEACAEPEEDECGEEVADDAADDAETTEEDAYPFQLNAELAQVFLKYRMTDKAIAHFERAIDQRRTQTNIEAPEYYMGLGAALARAEETERARQAYQKALQVLQQLLPNAENTLQHNRIITSIMEVCNILGLQDDRDRYLQRLRADDDNARHQLEIAQILNNAGHTERAENHFKRALELTAETPSDEAVVQVAYGRVLMAQERYAEALPLLEEAALVEEAGAETRKNARALVQNLCEVEGEEHEEVRDRARSLMLRVYSTPDGTETE